MLELATKTFIKTDLTATSDYLKFNIYDLIEINIPAMISEVLFISYITTDKIKLTQ